MINTTKEKCYLFKEWIGIAAGSVISIVGMACGTEKWLTALIISVVVLSVSLAMHFVYQRRINSIDDDKKTELVLYPARKSTLQAMENLLYSMKKRKKEKTEMPRYKVTLTEEEIQELKAMIQKGGKGYRIKHAQVLLKLNETPENETWTYERIRERH